MFGSLPICRVCLKPSLEYIDFDTPFEIDANSLTIQAIDNDLTYLDCFQACTRLEIEFNENCSQSLCSSCGLELKIAYEFLQKAEAADKVLRGLASRPKVENPDDEESKYYVQPDVSMEQNDNASNEEEIANKKGGSFAQQTERMESQLDDEKTFVCTVCGEQFFSQMVLNIHVNRSHSNNQVEEKSSASAVGKVECHVCDMVVSLDSLHAHMQMHGEESNYEVNEEQVNDETINEEEVMDDPEPEDEYEVFDTTNNFSDEEAINVNNDSLQEDGDDSPLDNYEAVDPDEEEMLLQVKDESNMKAKTRTKLPDSSDPEARFDVVEKIITDQEKQRKNRGNYKQCEICLKHVRTTSFEAHMNVHNGALKFPCDYCFQGYFSKRALQKHVRAAHSETVKAICKICNESIDSPTMKMHIEQKHSHVIKCTECNFECPELKMKEHVNRKHSQTKDFLCNVCSKSFSSLGILNAHLKYHERKESNIKSDACHICDKVFSSNHYLKSHMLTHQEQRSLLQCGYCDKTYHSKNSLDNHMRIHTGDTIKCLLCKKEFGRQYELNVHMRFHTKEYPFECELCHRKFAIKGHLRTHMWRHQGLKLQCEECGKLFTSTKALQEHSFYHSEMPFQCLYCPKAYPSKPKFKVHLKTAHLVEFTNEELQKMCKFTVPKRPRSKKFTLVQADTVLKEVEVHTKSETD